MGVILYGGAFDPPHLGHVAVAAAARERFRAERLVVLVSERPAHRAVHASPEDRLALARAAFPGDEVRLDPYPRTVELLRAEPFEDPVFVVGADQFAAFSPGASPPRCSSAPDSPSLRGRASRSRSSTPSSSSSPGLSACSSSRSSRTRPPRRRTSTRRRRCARRRSRPAGRRRPDRERGLYRP